MRCSQTPNQNRGKKGWDGSQVIFKNCFKFKEEEEKEVEEEEEEKEEEEGQCLTLRSESAFEKIKKTLFFIFCFKLICF